MQTFIAKFTTQHIVSKVKLLNNLHIYKLLNCEFANTNHSGFL